MLKNTALITISIILTLFIIMNLSSIGIGQERNDCDKGQVSTLSGDYTKTETWNCPPKTPLEFDDENTQDEIYPGSGVSVFVTGGVAPFTYEVTSGTGATWNASGTTSYPSNNREELLDLADGTWGPDYSASVSIKVTDKCGKEVTATLRATGEDANAPDWSDDITLECDDPGACGGFYTTYNIVGDKKYRLLYCYSTSDACLDVAPDCEATGSDLYCNEYYWDDHYDCSIIQDYYDVWGKGGSQDDCHLCYKPHKEVRYEQCGYYTWGCT